MATDKIFHDCAKYLSKTYFRSFKEVGLWETDLEFYYAENTLYILHSKKTNAYYFVHAVSPANALMQVVNGVI